MRWKIGEASSSATFAAARFASACVDLRAGAWVRLRVGVGVVEARDDFAFLHALAFFDENLHRRVRSIFDRDRR